MIVGEAITVGTWPQECPSPTPIEWLVVDGEPDQGYLLLSRWVLDCQRYNEDLRETTWRESSLRKWLCDEFLTTAFTDEEYGRIQLTHCGNNGPATPDTSDRVFLLSVDEIRSLTNAGVGEGLDRRTVATPFAVEQRESGRRLYVYDKSVEKDYIDVDGVSRGCSWWWTRSQPKAESGTSTTAAFVGPRGDVKTYGKVNIARYGVRPAIRYLRRP